MSSKLFSPTGCVANISALTETEETVAVAVMVKIHYL